MKPGGIGVCLHLISATCNEVGPLPHSLACWRSGSNEYRQYPITIHIFIYSLYFSYATPPISLLRKSHSFIFDTNSSRKAQVIRHHLWEIGRA
jgi:hypothetical protein